MKVLQFAFDSGSRQPIPASQLRARLLRLHRHSRQRHHCWVVSTRALAEEQEIRSFGTLAPDADEIHWKLIRLAYSSVADVAVLPLQDVLGLGSSARMNLPGQANGHWAWRATTDMLRFQPFERLRDMAETYSRVETKRSH